ncbi:Heavy-metal-associated, conserved site [Sesbania bispinosa]|nr:Heavy-metal-associated, conserved site [Sesbania bispinosa]
MPRYPKGGATVEEGSEVSAFFSVPGMSCAACAGSVEKAIKCLPGILEAFVDVVDVLNNRARILFYPSFVNEEEIREAIEDAGFEATLLTDAMSEKFVQVCRIQIKGMSCTSCSSTVESALVAIHGVVKARVALATEEAEVHYSPNVVSYNQILEAVEDTGFEAALISSSEDLSKIDLLVEGDLTDHSKRGHGYGGKHLATKHLRIDGVKDTIAVASCKVGLLDADVYGPNIPTMMNINAKPEITLACYLVLGSTLAMARLQGSSGNGVPTGSSSHGGLSSLSPVVVVGKATMGQGAASIRLQYCLLHCTFWF